MTFLVNLIPFLVFIFLVSCNSPQNNKISEPQVIVHQQNKLSFSFEKYSLKADIQWLSGPTGDIKVQNTMMVFIKNKEGHLEDLPERLTLNFYATMPSMGHPMEDAGFFEKIDTGIYLNKKIRFNMPGDWESILWLLDSEFEIKDEISWPSFF